jgi:hypothetical protein
VRALNQLDDEKTTIINLIEPTLLRHQAQIAGLPVESAPRELPHSFVSLCAPTAHPSS